MKKTIFFLAIFLVLFYVGGNPVLAINSNFETKNITDEKRQEILSNRSISFLEKEPKRGMIECFDIDKNGRYAVGFGNPFRKTVAIYSANGVFQYGYSFDCTGDFGVELNSNNIVISFVRSDTLAAFDETGMNLGVEKIIQHSDKNRQNWNHVLNKRKKIIGDTEYKITNGTWLFDLLPLTHTKLIATDSSGNVSVLYKSDMSSIIVVILVIGIALSIVAYVFVSMILAFKNYH